MLKRLKKQKVPNNPKNPPSKSTNFKKTKQKQKNMFKLTKNI